MASQTFPRAEFSFKHVLTSLDQKFQNGTRPAEGRTKKTMFRVPTHLRRIREECYNPQYFGFGLYGHMSEEVQVKASFTWAYRHEFVEIFTKICSVEFSEIYKQVSPEVGETSAKELVKLYDDFKEDSFAYNENFGNEIPNIPVSLEKIGLTLTIDAVFVVCFIIANHQRGCPRCKECQHVHLNEVLEREGLRSLLHLVRLDTIKFENQIPLSLIEKVISMIPANALRRPSCPSAKTIDEIKGSCNTFFCWQSKRATSDDSERLLPAIELVEQPREDTRSPDRFNVTVQDFIFLINCGLPGFIHENHIQIVRNMKFNHCKHLLECLYVVITYKSDEPVAGTVSDIEDDSRDDLLPDLLRLIFLAVSKRVATICNSLRTRVTHFCKGQDQIVDAGGGAGGEAAREGGEDPNDDRQGSQVIPQIRPQTATTAVCDVAIPISLEGITEDGEHAAVQGSTADPTSSQVQVQGSRSGSAPEQQEIQPDKEAYALESLEPNSGTGARSADRSARNVTVGDQPKTRRLIHFVLDRWLS